MKTQKLKKLKQENACFLIDNSTKIQLEMKKYGLLFITILLVITGCKDNYVKKPNNLIDRDVMIDIIYDLSILEAAKSQTMGVQSSYLKTSEFLKKKYKIDSLTFAENTKYYASDIKDYQKMYNEVKERIAAQTLELNGGKPITPNPNEGVVK